MDGRRGGWGRFAVHYLEMVVAMLAGMLVFGLVLGVLLGIVGLDYSHDDHPAAAALEMAFTMSLGMVVWMRFRGHGWPATLEMTAAMSAPLVVLYPLFWTGVISGETVMMLLHVLMFPAMAAVMLRRRAEYSSAHHMRGQRLLRFAGRAMVVVLAVGAVPGLVYVAGLRSHQDRSWRWR
ncbi:hypothetical protein ACFQ07_06115, partial [Actinomadura adrarensis]